MTPIIKCAWHKKLFGEEFIIKKGNEKIISHGICKECKKIMIEKFKNTKE